MPTSLPIQLPARKESFGARPSGDAPGRRITTKQRVVGRGPPLRRRRRWTLERRNYETRATSGSWAGPEVGLVGSELARRWGWHVAGAGRSRGRPGGTAGTAGTEPPRPRHPPLDHPRRQHQPGTHRRPAPTIGPGLRNQVTSRTVRGIQAVASILAFGTGWVAAKWEAHPGRDNPANDLSDATTPQPQRPTPT